MAQSVWFLVVGWLLAAGSVLAGNFYAGTTPATVPWPNGIVPYEFTNTLSPAMQRTYLDGLREWELAANVKFIPHTSESRWILFTYNTNGFDNVSVGYSPQVVSISSLSRSQVGHEMGHSFGFTHENIRPDQTNYLTVISNNVTSGNLVWFQIDPTSVTNGAYDFESVMHLGWDFASTQPGVLPTQSPKPPYLPRYQYRMGNLCLSPGDRAALKYLYGPPAVPLTNVVTTTADSGPGSLRAALYYVTDNPAASIRFNIPVSDLGYSNGVFNIHLTGHLPPLANDAMVIDGSTQPGFENRPLIFVDGSQILPETFTSNSGLLIYSAGNQVKNISFSGFNWNGLTLRFTDATNNTIAGCWLGLDATGTAATPNAYQGIFMDEGASHNFIGGTNGGAINVISGNAQYGIWISDSNTTGNAILGNFIGTSGDGFSAVANAAGGVILTGGTSGNVIGGATAAARNVLSGNTNAGLWLVGPGVCGNLVEGNFIGLNHNGTVALPNTYAGLYVVGGASSNRITDNVISGNDSEGIRLADAGTVANVVAGNFIGTDATGSTAIPNGFAGLTIFSGATSNLVGGTSVNARNIISGNDAYGVVIANAGTSGNLIQGNNIGLGLDGMSAVPNYDGILFSDQATNNTLGGTSVGAANFISGNAYRGVLIADPGTSGNFVQGNFIGTDRTGTNGVPNYNNVQIQNSATGNVIGGVAGGAGNVIAFAGWAGVILYDAGTTNNSVRGNSIFSNFGLGIRLTGADDFYPYVTANDLGDGDAGPNHLQNFPVITNAFGCGPGTIIQGNLNSTANRSFFIDVYRNDSPNGYNSYGQGQYYVGGLAVNTDGSGNANFALTNSAANYAGQYFTATATSLDGDTSEFNLAVQAINVPVSSATFVGPFQLLPNGFVFTLTWQTNFNYRIQAATNLAHIPVSWIDLAALTATNSSLTFTDNEAINYHERFYRVVSP